jgi:hypothetical protein
MEFPALMIGGSADRQWYHLRNEERSVLARRVDQPETVSQRAELANRPARVEREVAELIANLTARHRNVFTQTCPKALMIASLASMEARN